MLPLALSHQDTMESPQDAFWVTNWVVVWPWKGWR